MLDVAFQELLATSGQEALETMFFATPDSVSQNTQRPTGELLIASVAFRGTPPGRFGLMVSMQLARALGANFVGCENDADLLPAQVNEVMKELANIMCGAALTEIEASVTFDLGTPELTKVGNDEPGPDYSDTSLFTCRFEFPEGTLVSSLLFRESA